MMLGVTVKKLGEKTLLEFSSDVWDQYGIVCVTPNRLNSVTLESDIEVWLRLGYNGCFAMFSINDADKYEQHEFEDLVEWIWSQV